MKQRGEVINEMSTEAMAMEEEDRITIKIPVGEKKEAWEEARFLGVNLTSFTRMAIKEKMTRERIRRAEEERATQAA